MRHKPLHKPSLRKPALQSPGCWCCCRSLKKPPGDWTLYDGDDADSFEAEGFTVTERAVRLPEPIKSVGTYPVKVHLHADVNVDISVTVEGDGVPPPEPEPEAEAEGEAGAQPEAEATAESSPETGAEQASS